MDDYFNEMTNAQHEKGRLNPDKIEAEILANERTFLAWVRTSIAVMSLGFVIARFSLWMREMSSGVGSTLRIRAGGMHDRPRRHAYGFRGVAISRGQSGNRTGQDSSRSAHGHCNHRHYSDRCCGCDCLYDYFDSRGMTSAASQSSERTTA